MRMNLQDAIRNCIIIKYIKLSVSLTCIVLNTSCYMLEHTRKLSELEVKTIIDTRSNVEEVQTEVDSLLSHYGDSKRTFIYDSDNSTEIQALTNLAYVLNGMLIGIHERDTYMNESGYVYIRFNGHKNVEFLMMFKSDEDLSIIKSRYKQVYNNVYLR